MYLSKSKRRRWVVFYIFMFALVPFYVSDDSCFFFYADLIFDTGLDWVSLGGLGVVKKKGTANRRRILYSGRGY
jgi:hypothetical protein